MGYKGGPTAYFMSKVYALECMMHELNFVFWSFLLWFSAVLWIVEVVDGDLDK